ncbi:TetR/AcrR family transcriptional regulator [Sphingomonas ginsenosidivorax]|uniref:TetR/AcrR family transcriptional regulator n=1 Tax=Sphingomonas ginsenosidivorax TaxID=862135 RepID=A0A5C6UJ11_9SPHN|nr:TetR/AcrR family transcriptional regulator [Sphingomonas ginsenosidivorax]TXC72226.1 TetR/AcrR family transcriptional regulator [Sphingomonas ginsenosidivorax]
MTNDLNTVKFQYHHGQLPEALMDATEAILGEKGVEGFSLREAARRAGVSPSAPAHHFVDKRGLLTAVATRGFVDLIQALSDAENAAPAGAAARAVAIAYVRFAIDRPARFQLMWRGALLDQGNDTYRDVADRAFSMFSRIMTSKTTTIQAPGAVEDAPAIAVWALVHGFAVLMLDGIFVSEDQNADAVIARLLPAVLDNVSASGVNADSG